MPEPKSSERLIRLQQLTAALSRASTAERVVAAVVDHALEPLEACAGFVALLDGDGYLAITRALGPHEAQLPPCRFPLSAGVPAADAVRERRAILVESAAARDARYPSWSTGRWAGYGAWAALPLLTDGDPLGAMLLCFPDARTFSEEERTFMQTVATVCAQALDRARLYDREQRARKEIEAADRRKDEFLAMLAHELRNPLAPIVTALELAHLRGAERTPERAIIERQVKNLVRLVDDLLDVSRITRGKIELKTEPLELATAIANALEIARPFAERKGQRLDVSMPDRDVKVRGDAFRIAQVLANLLTNAVKYTPERGLIELRARREGSDVVVSIKDTGVGIAPEVLPTIFDMFVQGAAPLDGPHNAGLGIGLTLAKRLVELHGGTLTATSHGLGTGSEFVVRLSALRTAAEEDPTAAARSAGSPGAAPNRVRVLVVDDNEDAARLVVDALTVAGHDAVAALDAGEALRTLEGFLPDVAVLDIGLPGIDGYELAARIRAQPRFASLRLLALTGYGQERDRRRTAEAGFEGHLVKPVEMHELLACIARS